MVSAFYVFFLFFRSFSRLLRLLLVPRSFVFSFASELGVFFVFCLCLPSFFVPFLRPRALNDMSTHPPCHFAVTRRGDSPSRLPSLLAYIYFFVHAQRWGGIV